MTAKYNVHWYKTSWGLVGEQNTYSNFSDFVNSAHSEGYHGVEFPINALGLTPDNYDGALSSLAAHISELGLKVIPLIATRPVEWSSPTAHFVDFNKQLAAARILGASKVAVHAGADTFSMSDMISFFRKCIDEAEKLNITPCFETHRARPFYHPVVTLKVMEQIPELKLTSDLSHWVLVLDRLPYDCIELINQASARSDHIHARLGAEKLPQIVDPENSVWSEHLSFFLKQWDISFQNASKNKRPISVVPEYGPPPYMPVHPENGKSLGDIQTLNMWIKTKIEQVINTPEEVQ